MKARKTCLTRFVAVFASLMLLLTAVIVPVGAQTTGSAGAAIPGNSTVYDITYTDGIYTVDIDAERLAAILQSKSFDKETLFAVMPESLYNFLVNRDADSAMEVLYDLYSAATLDQLKEDLPVDVILDNFSTSELLSYVDIEALMSKIDWSGMTADELKAMFEDGALETYVATLDLSSFLMNDTDRLMALVSSLTPEEIIGAQKDSAIEDLIMSGAIDLSSPMTVGVAEQIITNINVAALPFDKILAVYPASELMNLFLSQNKSGLFSVLDMDYLLRMDEVRSVLSNLTLNDIKAIVDLETMKEELPSELLNVFLGNVEFIKLNDTAIYYNYQFDVAATETAVLQAIPTFSQVANLGSDGEVVAYVFTVSVNETLYTIGFKVKFTGDTSDIQSYAARVAEKVDYAFGADGSISLVVNAPQTLAQLYVDALDSEELSTEIKDKLFGIGNDTLEEGDITNAIDTLVNELTIAELKEILASVSLGGYSDALLEKLNLYESQAETIRTYLIKAIDKLLDVADSTGLADDVMEDLYNKTLSDFYLGQGAFHLSTEFSVDAAMVFDQIDSLPEGAENYFTNTTIAHTVDVSATISGLYQVQFLGNDGQVVYTAYRTEGSDLSELFALSEIAAIDATRWVDSNHNTVDPATATMPAADVTISPYSTFTATFMVDGVVVGTDEFSPDDPFSLEFPTIAEKHNYTLVWSPYTLGYADITIEGTYVPTVYTATFMDGDKLWAVVSYTFETIVSSFMPECPAAPMGYMVSWDFPFLTLADMTYHAVYTPITYNVIFVDKDGNEIAKVPFTVKDTEIELPEVPEVKGYKGEWPEFDLLDEEYFIENEFSFDRTVEPEYTAETYYITFADKDGKTIERVAFTIDDATVTEPAVPAVKGYTGGKWSTYTLVDEAVYAATGSYDQTVTPVYEKQTYYITFVDMDGKTVKKVSFTIDDTTVTAPAVPAAKGYTNGKWSSYTLKDESVYTKTGSYDQTVTPTYDLTTYYITFVDKDGKEVGKVDFTIKSTSIKNPAVPTLDGYTVTWPSFTLLDESVYTKTGSYNQTIKAVYTAIGEEKTYTATFMADGKEVGKVTFKATETKLSEPTVLAKEGYTGTWENYTLGASDITINAVYTAIEYTVTFVADGTTVATVTYTVENKDITEPSIPEKEGYTGKWESYTLTTGDMTVEAVYTAIGEAPEGGSLLWLWILLAVIVAGGIAVVVVFILKKKAA